MTIPNDKNTRLQSHGFSLLEVLVALLVLSVGLLGLAALQTTGLKFNRQSYQRTQAILQTYDMIDRIRANPVAKANGDYDAVASGAIPSYTDCGSSQCSPTQLASYDIALWNAANLSFLAEGKGAISVSPTSSSVRTITITWKENDLQQKFIVEADL